MAEKPKLPRVKAEKEETEEEEELNASLTSGGIEEGMRRLYWEFVRVEDQLDKRYWRPGKSTDKDEHDEPEQEEGTFLLMVQFKASPTKETYSRKRLRRRP